jgi:hypothetical protein
MHPRCYTLSTLCLLAPAALPQAGNPFTIVMLPDTQHYTQSAVNVAHFEAQTQWIVERLNSRRIVFTTMVGDLVENGAEGPFMNQDEWDRAVGAMNALDGNLSLAPNGLLPYAAVAGNHDYDVKWNKGPATKFIQYFGPSRYAGRTWFAGFSGNQLNMAQTFQANGELFLNLGLEWQPSDEAIQWAQSVLLAHPGVPTIVTTHEYLGTGNPAERSPLGETSNGSGNNSGESLYAKLVEPFPQIFMVLCGHTSFDGRLESTTALGSQVHQVLADYQDDPNGGNGWMQVIEVRPASSEIEFKTTSPTYVPGLTAGPDRSQSPGSNFVLGFDLDARRAELEATTARRFREEQTLGFATYWGTHDTFIGNGTPGQTLPNEAYGEAKDVRVDGDEANEQGLLRFDSIVGYGAEQIAPGTVIQRAILTVTTEGTGANSLDGGTLHRMLVAWSEASTWNSLGAGIQLGSEAVSIPDDVCMVGYKGTDSFDVTASVQAWLDGAPNYGWVFVAGGKDDWTFRSSEWTSVVERPLLTVLMDACSPPLAYCTAKPNSCGTLPSMGFSGTPSATAAGGFVIEAVGTKALKPGLLLYSDAGPAANAFGGGTLCVAPPVKRTIVVQDLIGTPGQCDGVLSLDMNAFASGVLGGNPLPSLRVPGTRIHAQVWGRDTVTQSLLSDAIAYTVCQ